VAQDGRRRTIRAVQEGLGGVKELRLLGREWYFVERFRAALTEVLDLQRFLLVQFNVLPAFIEWVAVTALLLVTVFLFWAGKPTESLLEMIALFALAMARLKGLIASVLKNFARARAGLVSIDVVDQDLREISTFLGGIRPKGNVTEEALRLTDSIRLRDLWFRYAASEDYVLRGIDLSIRAGEAVGFVGPSGGGKSTLVDVVLGILEPERGTVEVDGRDIRQGLRSWHRNVGYIPQSIYLIDGTIRQNVALGLEDKDIDDAAVARAMTAASLDEFVRSLPQGANTLIGERGVRLSGGQRQRIAIARALYNDPDVLIMDEATSALDNLTEKAVMEAVDALKGERTILMIAHRLSTVRNCDWIFFLCDGEVTGEGAYDDLVASHVDFAKIANVR
jgi:ATP-binding cassette subfamily C protein